MGKIYIQKYTSLLPISLIGHEAGVCWGADVNDDKKNFERGKTCLESGHFRPAEYPQVYIVLEGYSARMIRELYTHIGGAPTRLQASTRYINYGEFDYVIPPSVQKESVVKDTYIAAMNSISAYYKELEDLGVPKEDIANILPLGMASKVVLRTNLRNLIDMSHQRLCSRAYWEFREFMNDLMKALKEYSPEWEYVVDTYFKPKCAEVGYCCEEKSCGKYPRKIDK